MKIRKHANRIGKVGSVLLGFGAILIFVSFFVLMWGRPFSDFVAILFVFLGLGGFSFVGLGFYLIKKEMRIYDYLEGRLEEIKAEEQMVYGQMWKNIMYGLLVFTGFLMLISVPVNILSNIFNYLEGIIISLSIFVIGCLLLFSAWCIYKEKRYMFKMGAISLLLAVGSEGLSVTKASIVGNYGIIAFGILVLWMFLITFCALIVFYMKSRKRRKVVR
ncbi:MAG: hypothetical protein QMC80_07895 [Thermoplasmatales archaeon]|nr:hypothetical protein [Thermoplasmatales archaeon]